MTDKTRRVKRNASAEDAFYAELEGPARSFLKQEEKEQLADEAIPFTVTGIEQTTNKQYGDRWELTIEAADRPFPFEYPADNRIILTLPSHGARDHIMRKMSDVLTTKPVGPLTLTITELPDDQTWMGLSRPSTKK